MWESLGNTNSHIMWENIVKGTGEGNQHLYHQQLCDCYNHLLKIENEGVFNRYLRKLQFLLCWRKIKTMIITWSRNVSPRAIFHQHLKHFAASAREFVNILTTKGKDSYLIHIIFCQITFPSSHYNPELIMVNKNTRLNFFLLKNP